MTRNRHKSDAYLRASQKSRARLIREPAQDLHHLHYDPKFDLQHPVSQDGSPDADLPTEYGYSGSKSGVFSNKSLNKQKGEKSKELYMRGREVTQLCKKALPPQN
jgi:hypothetical protein